MNRLLTIFLLLPFWVSAQTISIAASDTTVCSGTTITFTASAVGSSLHYQWKKNNIHVGADAPVYISSALNNSDTIACSLVNAAHDTIYTSSNPIIVDVHTFPTAVTISGLDSICPADTIHLTASVVGGTWLASNYHASVENGVVTGVAANYFECSNFAQDTVFYIVADICGADTAEKVVTVLPQPNAYFELHSMWGSTVCLGAGVSATSGTTDFLCEGQLFARNGAVAIGGGGFIWGQRLGRDTVTNISANMCGISTYSMAVQVVDKPRFTTVLPGEMSLCEGSLDSIVAPNSGFNILNNSLYDTVSILWHTPNLTAVVHAISAGDDTIKVRIENECGATYSSFNVHISPKPTAITAPDSICVGYSSMLADNTPAGTWSASPSANIKIEGDGLVTGLENGASTVRYTMPTGCYVEKRILVENCEAEAEVTPVPSNGAVTIHTFVDVYESYSIINTLGQIALSSPLTGAFTNVDITKLPPAIYYIRLSGKNRNSGAIKVVKY
ncbi:hypothetical protein CJD36_011045 [Flavipsychrobacter stenotrophus]|uniref:Ig-like domain-containing protein n=1 Tax=Flavipsychrobacter stenotrophus TaxID=2077091 RepID=A0A2S7SV70_9BACT|nr:T9SS type A sorting domain-containing protein [Flavipsychrobacter stenotrophus]PQJ10505.1 hypothetical protein CJD36_011045 [Flavipsychrobacter stenotrophus]